MAIDELSRQWAGTLLERWDLPVRLASATEPGDAVRDWAESGALTVTGRRDGPAMLPPGAAATAARGAELAFDALCGQILDRDLASRDWRGLLGERVPLLGLHRNGPWSAGGTCRAVATADAWVAMSLARPDDVVAVAALTESAEIPADAHSAWKLLDEWAARTSTDDVVERAALLGMPCGGVPEAGTWSARAECGGYPAVVHETSTSYASDGTAKQPLVVDLSALWAGPLAARLLGFAGARVVKVELAGRLDGARRGSARFYELLHGGHDSVLLDPRAPEEVNLLRALLDRADIVIESSRPRALAALGIDAATRCVNSPVTWVSITAYGRDAGHRVGFGDDVAMSAGLTVRDADNTPLPVGDAIADPLTGLHAAVLALAAHCAGGSRLIDIAMRDVVATASSWHEPEHARRFVVNTATHEEKPTGPAADPGRDTERWREIVLGGT
ncbi:CoA transferase [Nocardia callitridis]|uniref:CoA transferase n=1 Tax=Nocardia callitridis TaxID=648753 RepID=A0ABP9K6U9_9NOCA